MFKLNNLYNSAPLEIEISYNNVTINFNISTIVNKRNKDEIDSDKQFVLLHAYLDYKGDAFKTALMNKYIEAEEILFDNIGRVEIMPLPYELVNGILELMDLEDVYHFIKNVYKYQALRSMPDEFDNKMVEDGLGTRVQTYTKTDYLQLIAFVQVLKSIIGPIGQFGFMNNSELGKIHNHYILFNFITQHKISESEPYIKLYGLVDKVIESVNRSEDESLIRIIEKRIPSDEMVVWVLSIVMMQKIAMATILDDTENKHIITRTYNFVNNKLKVKGDTSNAIRSKKSMVDTESGDGDQESILESYRITSNLPAGSVVELEWSLENLRDNPLKLCKNLDLKVYGDALSFTTKLHHGTLTRVQITLLGWVLKEVIDPRSLEYVKLDAIISSLALAFAYLWTHGFKYLALLLTSLQAEQDDTVVINFTTNKSRITKEHKDTLDTIFPYKKVIVTTATANREVNVAETSANNMADEFYKQRWIFTAPSEYILEVKDNASQTMLVPSDLKIQLANLIIHLNK